MVRSTRRTRSSPTPCVYSGSFDDAAYGVLHQARAKLARGDAVSAEQLAEEVELEFAALAQWMSATEATLVRAEALTRQGRARALLDLGRLTEAQADAQSGLELARAHSLVFEEANLLLVDAAIAAAAGDSSRRSEAAADAATILSRLGVQPPSG